MSMRHRGGLAFCLILPSIASGESIQVDSFEGGLTCTTVAPTTLVVDARSVVVQPVFLLNGQPFSDSPLQSGEFFLVPSEGEPVLLGTTFDPPAGIRVLTGVYDVQYQWRAGNQVPRNVAARVLQNVSIETSGPLVVDLPSTTLRGDLTMNGAPFPQTGIEAATLSLQGIHGLDRVVLGSSNDNTYNVRLIPGAYNLRYQSPGSNGAIPVNEDALRERHDIELDTQVRDFDIPAVVTQFLFQVNGGAFPGTLLENGILSLRTEWGDRIDLGESRFQTITRRVIPSTYDGYWEGLTGANTVPANPDSLFDKGLDIGDAVEVLNVPVAEVKGDFTYDGIAAPDLATENGRVWMRDPQTKAQIQLGDTRFGSFSRLVIPASYDLVYSRLTGANVTPANQTVVFERGRTIVADITADIDVPVALLAYNLTLNGSPFPGSGTEVGRVFTRSADDEEDVLLGDTNDFGVDGFDQLLVPGNYAPIYSFLLGTDDVPVNSRATLADVYLVPPNAPGTQTMDVYAGSFGFTFRNNGVAFAVDNARVASFELRHIEDVVPIGATNADLGFQTLIANVKPLEDGRTATAYYTWEAGDLTEMPQNVEHPVACFAFVIP